MAIIKLHGSPISTNTQRPLVCLYEKDLDFDFVSVDMSAGSHKQLPFLSLNVSSILYRMVLLTTPKINLSSSLTKYFSHSVKFPLSRMEIYSELKPEIPPPSFDLHSTRQQNQYQ